MDRTRTRSRAAVAMTLALAVVAGALLVACEAVPPSRIDALRTAAGVPLLTTDDGLTEAARAHSATMCTTGQVTASADPIHEYTSTGAVAVRDLVGSAVLDLSEPDPATRNVDATEAIWAGWQDDPTLVDPRWGSIGVGERTCADGRLYLTLVLRDDAPLDCRGTGSTALRDQRYRQLDGVDPNLVSLDLYLPVRDERCGPAPMVVYVHGGGYAIGDKANRAADKANLFTGEGWAFASVNYRLSPDPPNDLPGQVRYPMHQQDVGAALAWLRVQSGEHDLDPDRILLMGHSAGANLVSLLSTDTTLLAAAGVDVSAVRCTASLDTEYDATAQIAGGGNTAIVYRNALGNDPAVWVQASPITHASGPGPRPSFLIITRGTRARVNQAQAFGAALVAAGTPATTLDVNPLGHEDVNTRVGAAGDTVVTPPLVDFARGCLAP